MLKFIDGYNSLTLAYIQEGEARACNLWFARKDTTLYFLSSLSTLHGSELHNGKKISFTMHKDNEDYLQIKGYQGNGWCKVSNKKNIDIYTRKFPFISDEKLVPIVSRSELFEIEINWLRFIDNSVSFGYKIEESY